MTKTKIGILPLYLELYDRAMPEVRGRIDEFLSTIVQELGARGLDVVNAPICRIKPEFEAAVKQIEDARETVQRFQKDVAREVMGFDF